MTCVTEYSALAALVATADHVDVKTGEIPSAVGLSDAACLREFIAGCLSYNPGWIRRLYQIRRGFVRLLGMKQEGIPPTLCLQAADVPMQPGAQATFFTVHAAQEGRHWIVQATESHLTATLGIVLERAESRRCMHVITIVHYHRWTGPVYFNVIRPFHHLVVGQMLDAGVQRVVAQSNEPT